MFLDIASPQLPASVQWLLLIAVIFTACGTIWLGIKGVSRFLHAMYDLFDLVPVVKEIASQFKSDSGSSLKDQMNNLQKIAETAAASAETARLLAQDAAADLAAKADVVAEKADAMAALLKDVPPALPSPSGVPSVAPLSSGTPGEKIGEIFAPGDAIVGQGEKK